MNAYAGSTTAPVYEQAASAKMGHETTSQMAHEMKSMAMQQDTSSSMAHETSTVMAHEISTAMAHETSSTVAHETSTAVAHETSPSVMYGSGSYGNYEGGYDACVQQCQAQYGGAGASAPCLCFASFDPTPCFTGMAYTSTATATATAASETVSASATAAAAAVSGTPLVAQAGQVVVAPIKGDLRMVPFSALLSFAPAPFSSRTHLLPFPLADMVANAGDTIEYIWGAGPHT
jgi:hypothetical protein